MTKELKTEAEIVSDVQAKNNCIDCGKKINPLGLKGIEIEAQERFHQIEEPSGLLGISCGINIQDYAGIRWSEDGYMTIVPQADGLDDIDIALGGATADHVLFLLKAVKKLSKEVYSLRYCLDFRDASESGNPLPKFDEYKD